MQLSATASTSFYAPPPLKENPMRCHTGVLAGLLLTQWQKLSRREIENTRYMKDKLALLIEQKYGIDHVLAEHYLSNIERTLPQAA